MSNEQQEIKPTDFDSKKLAALCKAAIDSIDDESFYRDPQAVLEFLKYVKDPSEKLKSNKTLVNVNKLIALDLEDLKPERLQDVGFRNFIKITSGQIDAIKNAIYSIYRYIAKPEESENFLQLRDNALKNIAAKKPSASEKSTKAFLAAARNILSTFGLRNEKLFHSRLLSLITAAELIIKEPDLEDLEKAQQYIEEIFYLIWKYDKNDFFHLLEMLKEGEKTEQKTTNIESILKKINSLFTPHVVKWRQECFITDNGVSLRMVGKLIPERDSKTGKDGRDWFIKKLDPSEFYYHFERPQISNSQKKDTWVLVLEDVFHIVCPAKQPNQQPHSLESMRALGHPASFQSPLSTASATPSSTTSMASPTSSEASSETSNSTPSISSSKPSSLSGGPK